MQLLVKKSFSQGVGLFQMLCIHIHTNMNVVSMSQYIAVGMCVDMKYCFNINKSSYLK